MSQEPPAQPDEQTRSFFDWVSLNKFSSLPIANVGYWGTGLVPIAALVIIYINKAIIMAAAIKLISASQGNGKARLADTISALTMLSQEIKIGSSLILIYIASFSLGLGKLIYSARCPKKISRHGSYSRYVSYLASLAVALNEISNQRTKALSHVVRSRLSIAAQKGAGALPTRQHSRSNQEHQANRPDAVSDSDLPEEFVQAVSEYLERLATKPILDDFSSQVQQLLCNHRHDWYETNFSRPFTRYIIVALFTLSAACAAALFFVIAPSNVCSATDAKGFCDDILKSMGHLLANIYYELSEFIIRQLNAH